MSIIFLGRIIVDASIVIHFQEAQEAKMQKDDLMGKNY
jgi:hypothetical protein